MQVKERMSRRISKDRTRRLDGKVTLTDKVDNVPSTAEGNMWQPPERSDFKNIRLVPRVPAREGNVIRIRKNPTEIFDASKTG